MEGRFEPVLARVSCVLPLVTMLNCNLKCHDVFPPARPPNRERNRPHASARRPNPGPKAPREARAQRLDAAEHAATIGIAAGEPCRLASCRRKLSLRSVHTGRLHQSLFPPPSTFTIGVRLHSAPFTLHLHKAKPALAGLCFLFVEAPGIEPAKRQTPDTVEQLSGSIGVREDPADVPDRAPKSPIDRVDVTESSEGYELSNVVETALAKALVLAAESNRWEVVLQIAKELGRRGSEHRSARSGAQELPDPGVFRLRKR
jgi:hypothetical protein